MWSIYEIIHISELRLHIKVKNDHRSKFSNLSNWKEEAWKNEGFSGIRTHDLLNTGEMLYQLSYEAPMCGFIAQLVDIAEVMGSNPVEAFIFFRLLLSNCLNWKIYCDHHDFFRVLSNCLNWKIYRNDHSSLF